MTTPVFREEAPVLNETAPVFKEEVQEDVPVFVEPPRDERRDKGDVAIAAVAGLGRGVLRAFQGAGQSLAQLGEKAGVFEEGTAQMITDYYNQGQVEWENELKEFLGRDEGSTAFKTAKGTEIAGEILPLLMVPAGATGTLPVRVAKSAAIGGVLGHAMYQEDLSAKNSAAGITAIISGALPVVGAGAKAVFRARRGAKMSQVSERTRELVAEGYDPTIAFNRALAEVRPSTKAVEEAASVGPWLNLSSQAVQETAERRALSAGTYYGRLKEVAREAQAATNLGLEKLLTPVASRLDRMGLPHIAHAMRAHDMDTAILIQRRLEVKDALRGAMRPVPQLKQMKFKRAVLSGDTKAIDDILMTLPAKVSEELSTALKRTYSLLDDMHREATAQGVKVGRLENFFPREIRNWKAFAKKNGIPPTRVSKSLADAINKKHKLPEGERFSARDIDKRNIHDYLTDEEIATALSRQVFRTKPEATINSMTQHTRSRTRETLSDMDMLDYADLDESLTNYILGMTNRTQTRKFFGGSMLDKVGAVKEDIKVSAAVNSFMDDLVKTGKVLADDVAEVENIMMARFVEGSRSPSEFIKGLKNIVYSSTLGNPLAAMTQLGDLGASAYLNGVARAITKLPGAIRSAIPRRLGGKATEVSVESMGLNPLAHELEHLGTTARILNWSLRRSGFTAIDRIGKETILNSTLSKFRKLATTEKGRKLIREKYSSAFTPEEMDVLISDLAKGAAPTRNTKMVLWSELAKVQPISMSEMPEIYLRHPNGRIFYMLKTFTLKQLDLLRREAYDEIRKGNVVKGASNLLRLGAIIGTANGTVDQAKSFITGKEVNFEDAFFANILRNYAISDYTLELLKQGRPAEAIVRMLTPPVRVVEDPIRDVVEGFEKMRTLKDLPPFGKVMHYLFVDED